jgi:hypothetical protein
MVESRVSMLNAWEKGKVIADTKDSFAKRAIQFAQLSVAIFLASKRCRVYGDYFSSRNLKIAGIKNGYNMT